MSPERWQRVKEICDSALARAPAQRAAFVAEACGDDAELRREVDSQLGRNLSGRRVSHYEIVEKLGEGGMGQVYRAVDTRLGRTVAVKIVNAEFTRHFEHEARAVSALNHPHICTLYDVGEHEGDSYLVMEFVEGRPLKGPLPIRQALGYAVQTAQALAAAHKAGVVHRDLKPDNILLTGEGSVKVLDFGLAKLRPNIAPDATTLTWTTEQGVIAGTGPYMSPEQAQGEPVDARSDIFSFGAVLYELLSGRRAFGRETMGATLAAVITAEPPPLKETPPEVARIVARMLAKKRESRYQSADELLADLERVAQPEYRFLPRRLWFVQRLRWTPAGAIVLAMAAALIGGAIWWPHRSDPAPPNPAAVASTSAGALGRAEEYLKRYDKKGNVDAAIDVLQPALRTNPASAALQSCLAEAYVRKYRRDKDKKWLQMAVESGRGAVAANGFLEAAHVALGMALDANGQYAEAKSEFTRARDLNPLSAPAHVGLARLSSGPEVEQLYLKAIQCSRNWITLGELALFYSRNARYEESIERWLEALELTPDNVRVLSNLGGVLNTNGQYEEAGNIFQAALKYDETDESALSNLGTARYFQGDYLDAAQAFEKATKLSPKNHLYWGNLGDSCRWAEGHKSRAASAYKQAIRLAREGIATTPKDAALRGYLAVYLAKSGDTRGALAELTELEKFPESAQGASLFQSTVVYELAGDRDRALKALERAIRAGASRLEIANEPELASLRSDPRYAPIAGAPAAPKKK
jgi:eukaryotic-like serine/threonine-protein kinase